MSGIAIRRHIFGGGFNGEGARLDSVFLLVQSRGRFTARVVASSPAQLE